MKTLTEFSGIQIRMAAKAVAEARKALPKEVAQVAPAPPPSEPEPTAQQHDNFTQPAPEGERPASPSDAQDQVAAAEAAAGADAAQAAEAQAKEAAKEEKQAEEEAETDAVKAALDEAVTKATGLTGDRLDRLRAALKAVGRQAERVRLVRLVAPDAEEQIPQARKIGDLYF